MLCPQLCSKPLPELRQMAQIVPREDLERYLVDAAILPLVDQIERLSEEIYAGWPVDIGRLEPWEAELLVFMRTAERQMERQIQIQALMVRGIT